MLGSPKAPTEVGPMSPPRKRDLLSKEVIEDGEEDSVPSVFIPTLALSIALTSLLPELEVVALKGMGESDVRNYFGVSSFWYLEISYFELYNGR
ncbi:hypothetical protein TSUD_330830 [Trifolium subterraneum]|nr:hypothetical protein TSUD_330830 [Trifolium subterraneum]